MGLSLLLDGSLFVLLLWGLGTLLGLLRLGPLGCAACVDICLVDSPAAAAFAFGLLTAPPVLLLGLPLHPAGVVAAAGLPALLSATGRTALLLLALDPPVGPMQGLVPMLGNSLE